MLLRNDRRSMFPGWWVLGFLLLFVPGACTGGEDDRPGGGEEEAATDPEIWEGDIVAATRALRPQEGTDRDWEIFRSIVTRVWGEGWDTLPMNEAMVRTGLLFVGTPYAPGTLEVAGSEAVVMNLEELDCVTFVENVLALNRFVRIQDQGILESEWETRDAYRAALREIRYRSGRIDGYPSRLHYFSDWILDNESKGLVQEMTQDMGGEEDIRAIDFMTTHPEAYRQLADLANLRTIQQTEYQLSLLTRFKIPEDRISTRMSGIRNGDIIAATSTVEGLDVAHTGLAYWQGSELYLLHAPLVGGNVEVSRQPLAERILRLDGQDGIRVVRVLDPADPGVGDSLP